MEKIAVLAPMPSASVSTTAIVKPGTAAEAAAHVPRVAQHALEKMAGVNLVAGFFLFEHAAESSPRLEPRVGFAHASAHEFARL